VDAGWRWLRAGSCRTVPVLSRGLGEAPPGVSLLRAVGAVALIIELASYTTFAICAIRLERPALSSASCLRLNDVADRSPRRSIYITFRGAQYGDRAATIAALTMNSEQDRFCFDRGAADQYAGPAMFMAERVTPAPCDRLLDPDHRRRDAVCALLELNERADRCRAIAPNSRHP